MVLAAPILAVQIFVNPEYPASTPNSSNHALDDAICSATAGEEDSASSTDQLSTVRFEACRAADTSDASEETSDESGRSST
jgi:hypothetical protein